MLGCKVYHAKCSQGAKCTGDQSVRQPTLGTINFQQQIKDMDDPSDLLYYFHITRWQDVYNVHITTYEEYE